VNIIPHYSEKDDTLIKVMVRGINLGVRFPILFSEIHCMLLHNNNYEYCIM
jgi:hypothetical protein